jgi:hypothetical protein
MSKDVFCKTLKNKFVIDELWFRDRDKNFWGIDRDGDKLRYLEGYFEGDVCKYKFIDGIYQQVIIDNMINQKIEEGYECFAMLL